jgi:hypothetical protein
MASEEWLHFEWWWEQRGIWLGRGLGWSLEKVGITMPTGGRPLDRIRSAKRQRRETAELRSLLVQLERYREHSEETRNALCQRVCKQLLDVETTPPPLLEAAKTLLQNLLLYEGHFVIPAVNLNRQLSIGEVWEHTKNARRQLMLFENPQTTQRIEDILRLFIVNLLDDRLARRPTPTQEDETISVPLYSIRV